MLPLTKYFIDLAQSDISDITLSACVMVGRVICSGDVDKYHPSTIRYSHVPLLSVFLCTCTDMPIGASGIFLLSKGPLRWAYAETFGVALE